LSKSLLNLLTVRLSGWQAFTLVAHTNFHCPASRLQYDPLAPYLSLPAISIPDVPATALARQGEPISGSTAGRKQLQAILSGHTTFFLSKKSGLICNVSMQKIVTRFRQKIVTAHRQR
jgi:hypothetical protein